MDALIKYFLFFVCMTLCFAAHGEVIHDGWVWEYHYRHRIGTDAFSTYEYSFGDEVEINGKYYRSFNCLRNTLYQFDRYGQLSSSQQPLRETWYFREENGETYVLCPELFNYERPLYNFNLKVGDIFESTSYDYIYDPGIDKFFKIENIIENEEELFVGRVLEVSSTETNDLRKISENMGFLEYGELGYTIFARRTDGSYGPELSSVKDAEGNELYNSLTNNVSDLVDESRGEEIVYDIMGRRVEASGMTTGSVYIRNGRKFVCKKFKFMN